MIDIFKSIILIENIFNEDYLNNYITNIMSDYLISSRNIWLVSNQDDKILQKFKTKKIGEHVFLTTIIIN